MKEKRLDACFKAIKLSNSYICNQIAVFRSLKEKDITVYSINPSKTIIETFHATELIKIAEGLRLHTYISIDDKNRCYLKIF
jgi:hypothetical protein